MSRSFLSSDGIIEKGGDAEAQKHHRLFAEALRHYEKQRGIMAGQPHRHGIVENSGVPYVLILDHDRFMRTGQGRGKKVTILLDL